MAIPGQRFELDLDADDFTINPIDESSLTEAFRIRDIQEHDSTDVVAPPKPKASSSGFPEHKQRRVSRFKQKQDRARQHANENPPPRGPSDAAIAHKLSQKHGTDPESLQKAEIGQENDRRLAAMSAEEIDEARAEIMDTLSPALLERLLKRSRIDTDAPASQELSQASAPSTEDSKAKKVTFDEDDSSVTEKARQAASGVSESSANDQLLPPAETSTTASPPTNTVHFPAPPRSPSDYRALDPSSPTFLSDLKSTYFPELAHAPSPSALEWLQTPSPNDADTPSSYSPSLPSYPASAIRFTFTGALLPPTKSLTLPTTLGLHHHGEAPDSAGYTIPELTLLARSTLPNQRCVAYQTLGRILYRLGKEEFGKKGGDMYEALWDEVERSRCLELVLAEAGREKGHASARAYAVECAWLWRKGCDGERGLKRQKDGNGEGAWEEGLSF
jgi:RNA polymerase II-associated protein 1